MLLGLSLSLTHRTQQIRICHISQQVFLVWWEDVVSYWPDPKLAVKNFPLFASCYRTYARLVCKLAPAYKLTLLPYSRFLLSPLWCKVSINSKCTRCSIPLLCFILPSKFFNSRSNDDSTSCILFFAQICTGGHLFTCIDWWVHVSYTHVNFASQLMAFTCLFRVTCCGLLSCEHLYLPC